MFVLFIAMLADIHMVRFIRVQSVQFCHHYLEDMMIIKNFLMHPHLCGACTEVCPVKIPLHELLHKHRQVIVEKEGKAPDF